MEIQLLGSPRVRFGNRWTDIPNAKPMLLVYYLAFEGGWMSREELAFFFRPEADEASARHYVRKMLCEIKQLPWAGDLEVEKDRLRWQADSDVKNFSEAARAGRYAEALGLYGGDLLENLRVENSPSFEAWLEYRREELATLWHDVCLGHAVELESAGNHREAADTAKKLLERDSLAEDALQSYIRNTYLAGKRDLALRAAATFQQELKRELGLEPLMETQRLIEAVKRSEAIVQHQSSRKHGRRKTDRPPLPPEQQNLIELFQLLRDPQIRLLDISNVASDGSLILSRRIPDVAPALYAIVDLAEWLVSQQQYMRAEELLSLVLSHPLCDERTSTKARHIRIFVSEQPVRELLSESPTLPSI